MASIITGFFFIKFCMFGKIISISYNNDFREHEKNKFSRTPNMY